MERTASVGVFGVGGDYGDIIKAKDDGGCCVARDKVVYVYDWMLKQEAALDLDYGCVTDVAFMGTQRLLIGTEKGEVDRQTGAMACFDIASREVVHRYELRHEGQVKDFRVTGFATNNDEHVFALCTCIVGQREDPGVGIWDPTTGRQIQYLPYTESQDSDFNLHSRSRLQWLQNSKLLFVATHSPTNSARCWLSLFDIRADKFVWPSSPIYADTTLMDVVAMDHSSTLWTRDMCDRLGFLDIRVGSGSTRTDAIRWGAPGDVLRPMRSPTSSDGKQYRFPFREPRLDCWGSQLFATIDDTVCVVSSDDWRAGACTLTGILRREEGGGIADITVGGGRLFILHAGSDSFEVWETPRNKGNWVTSHN